MSQTCSRLRVVQLVLTEPGGFRPKNRTGVIRHEIDGFPEERLKSDGTIDDLVVWSRQSNVVRRVKQ